MYSSAICFILLTYSPEGELPYAVAEVHLFWLLYSIAWYQRPSLYAFFCRGAFACFWGFAIVRRAAVNILYLFPGAHVHKGFCAILGKKCRYCGDAQPQFYYIMPDGYSTAVDGFFWTSFQNLILS